MPKKASRDTLLRQWSMLSVLPRRGSGISSSDLRRHLEDCGYVVDVRTVQRDLVYLSQCFPIRCNDRSVPHGWLWAADADFNIPSMSVPNALTMKMVEAYLQPLLPASVLQVLQPHINHAARVLAQVEGDNAAARWSDKVRVVHPAMTTMAPAVDDDVLEKIQDAVMGERQIEVEYQRLGQEHTQSLRLHPLALIQRGPVLYLIACAFDYEDVRIYALHRCRKAQVLAEALRRPGDFSVDAFIAAGKMHFGAAESIDLHLWVDAELAAVLRESPLAEDMQMQALASGYEVAARLPLTWQLKWWLLSQGSSLSVLAPAALRAEIAADLRATLARYEDAQSPGL